MPYMTRLKETSEECDLHNISDEDVVLLIATMHCNKEDLRKDIKRYRNPTWLTVEQLAKTTNDLWLTKNHTRSVK